MCLLYFVLFEMTTTTTYLTCNYPLTMPVKMYDTQRSALNARRFCEYWIVVNCIEANSVMTSGSLVRKLNSIEWNLVLFFRTILNQFRYAVVHFIGRRQNVWRTGEVTLFKLNLAKNINSESMLVFLCSLYFMNFIEFFSSVCCFRFVESITQNDNKPVSHQCIVITTSFPRTER